MSLHVTTLVAGLMALMMVPLSLQISIRRARTGVVLGDAGDETLRRRIRAHGNFTEYVPLGLGLLALIEWNDAPTLAVWAFGAILLLTRALHLYGMLYTSRTAPRAIAMVVQHVAFVVSGAWLIAAHLTHSV